jgi:hypothetical protein
MRRFLASAVLAGAATLAFTTPAFAGTGNPNGTGPPSQSCQAQPSEPGHAVNSPGSPFHEPGTTGPNDPGGTGGLHYSPKSQYDVACYHVSNPPTHG